MSVRRVASCEGKGGKAPVCQTGLISDFHTRMPRYMSELGAGDGIGRVWVEHCGLSNGSAPADQENQV